MGTRKPIKSNETNIHILQEEKNGDQRATYVWKMAADIYHKLLQSNSLKITISGWSHYKYTKNPANVLYT